MTALGGYHKGLSAERIVASHYTSAGAELLDARWRGPAGEIDLVFRTARETIFVEVKAARDHSSALRRLGARQMSRIARSAEIYMDRSGMPLAPMRIDVAAVNASGDVAIVENALLN